jgi:hypothetical protein
VKWENMARVGESFTHGQNLPYVYLCASSGGTWFDIWSGFCSKHTMVVHCLIMLRS